MAILIAFSHQSVAGFAVEIVYSLSILAFFAVATARNWPSFGALVAGSFVSPGRHRDVAPGVGHLSQVLASGRLT